MKWRFKQFTKMLTDLAFQIINLNGDLVNSVNQQGYTPLHLLATKSDAFKSGTRLGCWRSILYQCEWVHILPPLIILTIATAYPWFYPLAPPFVPVGIFVDQMKVEPPEYGALVEERLTKRKNVYCPDNYKTNFLFFQLIKQTVQVGTYDDGSINLYVYYYYFTPF